MIKLYTDEEFINAKSSDKLPCECIVCGNLFYKQKRVIKRTINAYDGNSGNFCSRKCYRFSLGGVQSVKCANCGKEHIARNSEIKKSKSGNHFCSQSCSGTYNNKHKTKGNRRSKLEAYLEQELSKLYPNLEILFNRKTLINSELDIYVPSLKLAFELNGILHYEPIHGDEKLEKIMLNDNNKIYRCLMNGIELHVINTTEQKYFKESTSKKYLNIIIDIINTRP